MNLIYNISIKLLFALAVTITAVMAQNDTTIVISGESDIITLDGKSPDLNIDTPNGGEEYDAGTTASINWSAADESFDSDAISIYLSPELGGSFDQLEDGIANSGNASVTLPDINSAFVRLKVTAVDHYGNSNIDFSDGYFTVGDPYIWDGTGGDEEVSLEITGESSDFTGDSKIPELAWLSPNGGEEYVSGVTIDAIWSGFDDSFDESPISIYLSANLGGNFTSMAEDIGNSGSTTLGLPAVNSAFARFQITAIDHFGNTNEDYSDNYFTIGSPYIPGDGFGINDTTISFQDESDEFIGDSKSPELEWLYPNGGEQFDNFETVTVEWSAEDESFGDEAISIYLSTELGGYYNSVAEGVPNTESLDIDLPSADEAFARFKATATDLFGNTSEDYGDNYFILGDPFGEYNVNPLDDIVVIDWGWGEYQMIYVENDALDFLNEGDEIHVIDQNGIITEDCAEEGYGVVSVASHPYMPGYASPYPLYSIGGVDYCEESEYIAPGYVEGNPINFAHYDESESTLNYLDPEYDSGNGLFGVEFEDTLRFQYFDESENLVYDLYETIIFSPDMIEGNAIIPVQFTVNYSTETSGTPDWEINIHDYEFNGSITSAVYEMGELITDSGDRIAAFVNNVCRGTIDAVETPDPIFEEVVFHLMVYGNLPITVVTSFTQLETRLSETEIMYNTSDRELNQFNVYRNSELVGQSITDFYYMDETTESGEDYCYQIMLLDDEGNELLESMEQCIAIEANYIAGDLNQDGTINVLDVVMVVDLILNNPNPTEMEMLLGDLNSDGFINVLDIVMIMDIILGGGLARENPTHEASFLYGNGIVNYKSDGKLAGIQLEVMGDFEITDNYLPDGWEIAFSEETIIMYSLDGSDLENKTLFEYTGDLTIESAIAADWHGSEIMVNSMMLPRDFALSPAYPNPFNPVTNIRFSLPINSEVSLSIYNLQGREVSTLIDANMDAGYHSVVWDANSYASGVYFVKMVAGEFVNTQKLMLVK